MRIKFLFVLIIYFVNSLIISCEQKSDESILLQKARKLTDSYPEEALKSIDSIQSPENNLSLEEYMQYLVAHTQIYHKNYLSIENDSLIFEAVRYYQKKLKDPKQTALAYFYAGSVLRSQKKYDRSMEYFKEAEIHAKKSLDSATVGLINFNVGDLLAEQGLYRYALFNYDLAAKNYRKYPEKQAHSFSSMGRMYLFKKNTDSAFMFFHRGLRIAENLKNKNLQRQLAESLAVAYEQVKNFGESKKYLLYSLNFNTDSARLPRYYLNFALLFDKIPLKDSTAHYAQKLKEELSKINDKYLRASILSFLIDYEKRRQQISSAFNYQTDRMKVLSQIMSEREKQSVLKIEKKYNYEQVKKQYYENLSKKQGWIIILMSTIILGGILFLFYRTKQKNRQAAILGQMDTLAEMNRDLESTVRKKQSDLRRELLWRFGITKKFLKINEEISKKGKNTTETGLLLKRFNTIVYGQSSLDEQWETLHQAFRQARPNYSEKIKQHYPEITETEFRICILTYADFSIKEIALILQQSPNTIQTRRTSLRKKMGVRNGGDIADSIDRLIG